MSDLISRQAAIDAFIVYSEYESNRTNVEWVARIHRILLSLPAQPERRRGKWEQVEVNYIADMDDEIKESMVIASMFCPCCKRYHNEVYMYGNPTFGVRYCSNCGADMREDDNGQT